ncbi:hypothetical protein HMPREF3150_02330 [Pseudomonas aeruginosa]|nr:hypothetical protein HMPREF3150_02330 [Pseudomonas aeruginosa]
MEGHGERELDAGKVDSLQSEHGNSSSGSRPFRLTCGFAVLPHAQRYARFWNTSFSYRSCHWKATAALDGRNAGRVASRFPDRPP